jgi:hypothetical protein
MQRFIKLLLNGNFIKTWHNTKTAGEFLNIKCTSITSCMSGKYKTAGGFIWKKLLKQKGGNCA